METRKYLAVAVAPNQMGKGPGAYFGTTIMHHASEDRAAIVKWSRNYVSAHKTPIYVAEIVEKIATKEVPVEITELAIPEIPERSK